MEEQITYRPIAGLDEEFHIKEPTGGTYKSIKMLMLKSVTTAVAQKLAIAKEFKLIKDFADKDETKKYMKEIDKDELSTEGFYEQLLPTLFMEDTKNAKYDVINLREVNRATNDFFTLVTGT